VVKTVPNYEASEGRYWLVKTLV